MINFGPTIKRIKALLAEDTEASVTYAALEARLALEKICYDRLRQRHEYISHDQLSKWQPGGLINQLLTDVDEHVTQTRILRMGRQPAKGVKAADEDFVDLGTEVGFDAKRITKMWNALSRLALLVKLPEHKNDRIPEYGDQGEIRAKVEKVLAELERQAKATMSFSGFGETVSFNCGICGDKNKRRAALLREGQRVFCVNPKCDASWTVKKDGEEIGFQGETCDFNCPQCGQLMCLPWRFFSERLKFGNRAVFRCGGCNHQNYVEWRLTHLTQGNPGGDDA
jgi:hypothetical protein